jgi:hypothetical protein
MLINMVSGGNTIGEALIKWFFREINIPIEL